MVECAVGKHGVLLYAESDSDCIEHKVSSAVQQRVRSPGNCQQLQRSASAMSVAHCADLAVGYRWQASPAWATWLLQLLVGTC